jgi:L-2-hydroxyglutarate oxidase LhgO
LTVLLGYEVVAIAERAGEVRVRTEAGRPRKAAGATEDLAFDLLILCASLESDRLAVFAGDDRNPAIVPFRGEYHLLVPDRAELIRGSSIPYPTLATRLSAYTSPRGTGRRPL